MKKSKVENILSKSIKGEKQNRLKESFKWITLKERSCWLRNICITLLVFLVILSSLFIYVYFISKQDSEIKNDTSLEFTSEEDIEEENPENTEPWNSPIYGTITHIANNMKEYVNSYVGIKFVLPKSWIVKESDCFDSFGCTLRFEESENDDSYFEYYLAEMGFSFCYYSDSKSEYKERDEEEIGNSYYIFEADYTSIDEKDTFRRTYLSEDGIYMICKESEEPKLFTNSLNPGFVSYKIDIDSPNLEEILTIMDRILLSYEYFGEGYEN